MKFVISTNEEGGLLYTIEARICDAGAASPQDFGGTWEGGFCIQQNPIELAALIRRLMLHAWSKGGYNHTLDIGTAAGGTTRMIREYVAVKTTTIVDDGKHEQFHVWEENRQHIGDYTEIIGNSHAPETIEAVRKLDRKFDLVMIDAGHTYDDVKQDYENYREFFADGAVVWFHDTVCCPDSVGRYWEEVKDEGHRVLIDTGIYLGIGAIEWRSR